LSDSRDRTRRQQRGQRTDLQALTPDEQLLLQGYRALDETQKAGVHGLIEGFTSYDTAGTGQDFQSPVGQVLRH
jgi:hypothetical protein